jgi:hypothetical protein
MLVDLLLQRFEPVGEVFPTPGQLGWLRRLVM